MIKIKLEVIPWESKTLQVMHDQWPTTAQSWNKVFDNIVLIIFSTPFLKVGCRVKDPISIHSNVAHLSFSMMELLVSCWISTSSICSLLTSCQSENLRAQRSRSHIAESPPWSSEGIFSHAWCSHAIWNLNHMKTQFK
jgi:hypothetical protein